MRTQMIRQIDDSGMLKILGLNEDDVLIEIARFENFGTLPFQGWRIKYSVKVVKSKKEVEKK